MKKLSTRYLLFLLISLFCWGCARTCVEDFQEDAKKDINRMIKILSTVETKEDLVEHSYKLKKIINHLVNLMIESKELESGSSLEIKPVYWENSMKLKKEMERIYQIEGAFEIFDEIKRDALHKLDLHYQRDSRPNSFS